MRKLIYSLVLALTLSMIPQDAICQSRVDKLIKTMKDGLKIGIVVTSENILGNQIRPLPGPVIGPVRGPLNMDNLLVCNSPVPRLKPSLPVDYKTLLAKIPSINYEAEMMRLRIMILNSSLVRIDELERMLVIELDKDPEDFSPERYLLLADEKHFEEQRYQTLLQLSKDAHTDRSNSDLIEKMVHLSHRKFYIVPRLHIDTPRYLATTSEQNLKLSL